MLDFETESYGSNALIPCELDGGFQPAQGWHIRGNMDREIAELRSQ
jgi:hypothetical protein